METTSFKVPIARIPTLLPGCLLYTSLAALELHLSRQCLLFRSFFYLYHKHRCRSVIQFLFLTPHLLPDILIHPVSYTHLDVYKRQTFLHNIKNQTIFRQLILEFFLLLLHHIYKAYIRKIISHALHNRPYTSCIYFEVIAFFVIFFIKFYKLIGKPGTGIQGNAQIFCHIFMSHLFQDLRIIYNSAGILIRLLSLIHISRKRSVPQWSLRLLQH